MKRAMLVITVVCIFASISYGADVLLQNGTSTNCQDPTGIYGTPWSPENCLNGSWEAWSTQQCPVGQSQVATWETQSDIGFVKGTRLDFEIIHTDGGGYALGDTLLGRFRISVTTDDRSTYCDSVYLDGDVDSEPNGWVSLMPEDWSISWSDAPMEFIDLGDDSLLVDMSKGVSSTSNYETIYDMTAYTTLVGITGIRLDALAHNSLPGGGPGTQAGTGALWLSEFIVTATEVNIVAETSESDGETEVKEGGYTDTFTVVLRSLPTANVTISVDPDVDISLNGAAAGQAISLVFQPSDWDTPQTVTVSAIDDALEEGIEQSMVEFSSTSTDPSFDGGMVIPLRITVIDDDVAGIVLTGAGVNELNVSEEDTTSDSYTIELTYPPTADVNISLSDISDINQVLIVPDELVFTSTDWNVPQIVTVTAIDDIISEPDMHPAVIHHIVESDDLGYDGFVIDDVVLNIAENECGAWGILPGDLNNDCHVDFVDMALIAAEWLDSTMPYGCVQKTAINGVTIEAVSSQFSGREAVHLVDGSGLNVNGLYTHSSNADDENMWLTDGTAPAGEWVIFDLGGLYDIKYLRVWNYNESPTVSHVLRRGARQVEILVSADNVTYASKGVYNFAIASGSGAVNFAEILPLIANDVRYVKFNIISNHGSGDRHVGLSEVQFIAN